MSKGTLVDDNMVVTISYTLKNNKGEILDSSDENGDLEYLHGYEGIMPGLEKALHGKTIGHKIDVTLSGDDAYGEYDENLIFSVPKSEFPDDITLEEGLEFEAEIQDSIRYCTVENIDDEGIVRVNANHPLAGEILHIVATILAIREGTDEELDHGHVHSEGHDHH